VPAHNVVTSKLLIPIERLAAIHETLGRFLQEQTGG
jgi:hypothetical protein